MQSINNINLLLIYMKFILIVLVITILPIKAKGQICNTDQVDTKSLNIHGNPKHVVIREKSLNSNKYVKLQNFYFDTTGRCVESIKESFIGSKAITTVVKYKYKQGRLERMEQIESTDLGSDTLVNEYVYTGDGSLKQKTCYQVINSKLKISNYFTYKADSIDNNTINTSFNVFFGEKNGIPQFVEYLGRDSYNSDGQIVYSIFNGMKYRTYYDNLARETRIYECIGNDSTLTVIDKYDEYGNEIEHFGNIYCNNKKHTDLDKQKYDFSNQFINYCLNECKHKLENNTRSPLDYIIYTFYKYDELKNIRQKFIFKACSGSIYYTTYEYFF